jgi:hypothetical protein
MGVLAEPDWAPRVILNLNKVKAGEYNDHDGQLGENRDKNGNDFPVKLWFCQMMVYCFNTKLLYDSRRLLVVGCLNKVRVAEPECYRKHVYLIVYGRRNTRYPDPRVWYRWCSQGLVCLGMYVCCEHPRIPQRTPSLNAVSETYLGQESEHAIQGL